MLDMTHTVAIGDTVEVRMLRKGAPAKGDPWLPMVVVDILRDKKTGTLRECKVIGKDQTGKDRESWVYARYLRPVSQAAEMPEAEEVTDVAA